MKQVFFRMVGKPNGTEIVNEGHETPELARAYGLPEHPRAIVRWIFHNITPNSFDWRSERSTDGQTWQLQREYFAHRTKLQAAAR